MRLLVSVRSALEVVPALQGGADIIDAKEPANGSLGRVSPTALHAITRRVPDQCALSIALGDLTRPAQVRDAFHQSYPARAGDTFVKLGFAGLASPVSIAALLAEAVRLSGAVSGLQVVAVAYADHVRAGTVPLGDISDIAADSGASGVLLDTSIKDGKDLFSWVSPLQLEGWIATIREKGLLAAVAGSLRAQSFAAACAAHPDVVGVRGAACVGGRTGRIDRGRVARLRALLPQAALSRRTG
ncbi:MAG TPA: (5-formylfuran-3-yl)methyl phosphate synthase [Gemmatimonadales bacterium]|jgi:uncharacterized protein (UPF0264 family)